MGVARPQDGADQLPAGAVVDHQRVVDVVVEKAVEERKLLRAVRLVVGGVDVEDHHLGVGGQTLHVAALQPPH